MTTKANDDGPSPEKRKKRESLQEADDAFMSVANKSSPPRKSQVSSVAVVVDEGLAKVELGDVAVAMRVLSAKFPVVRDELPPIVLRSQLHAIVEDRTAADREIDRLRTENKIRVFRAISDASSMAEHDYFVATADYVERISIASRSFQSCGDVFDRFAAVLSKFTDVSAREAELEESMNGRSDGGDPKQDCCTVLVRAGFLVQRGGLLWFAIPNAGRFLVMCRDGREELVSAISRRKPVAEVPLKELLDYRLRRSILGVEFHLTDLRGLNVIREVVSPIGPLVQLIELKK